MKIEVFFIPSFIESEEMFRNSIVIMIDVLRAGTTLVTALNNGAKEVIPIENFDKAISIYTNLSKETRFLGGERNGLKPTGFNAGNSPKEYIREAIQGKTIVLTTTNGSKIYQRAKNAKHRIAGSFVNKSAVVEFVTKRLEQDSNKNYNIDILCAGNNGRFSLEDALCAGAFAEIFVRKCELEQTDSTRVAVELYKFHKDNISEYIKESDHSKYLKSIGMDDDIDISLKEDIYSIVPYLSGSSFKIYTE